MKFFMSPRMAKFVPLMVVAISVAMLVAKGGGGGGVRFH